MRFDVVIPTTGRPSLGTLLRSLAAQAGPAPERVVVVDDGPGRAVAAHVPTALRDRTVVARTGPAARTSGRGPAAARNAGVRAGAAPWVALLDDDVVLPAGWTRALAADLEGLPADVAASQGRLVVPLPRGRRPTDWERQVAGLQDACWATADLAAGGPRWKRRAASTSASPAPSARTPTWRCGSPPRGTASCAGGDGRCTRSRPPGAG